MILLISVKLRVHRLRFHTSGIAWHLPMVSRTSPPSRRHSVFASSTSCPSSALSCTFDITELQWISRFICEEIDSSKISATMTLARFIGWVLAVLPMPPQHSMVSWLHPSWPTNSWSGYRFQLQTLTFSSMITFNNKLCQKRRVSHSVSWAYVINYLK